ncbi:MAG TPA: hypothetical protein VNV37_01565 [Solirubrobacteraceae bacterium]|jgi:hypothetical protein|nr:hypothetical protein [Solirubrobacteraceae bacterium]
MSSTIPEPGAPGARYQSEPAPVNGWIIFAGVIMLIEGFLDAMWGLAAVINNEVITVGGHGVIVWDISAWGWGHLILGTLVALTGLGLLAQQSWARWLGIVFVSLDLLVQFGTFTLFPLWSIMIIAIDILILYQLTARWETAA